MNQSIAMPDWRQRVRHLLELIRFSHTVFALPFALLAAAMAWHLSGEQQDAAPFSFIAAFGIVGCMVGARSFAMGMNRLTDWQLDAKNPRTQDRHLPAGLVSQRSVVLLCLSSAALFVVGTCLFWPNFLPLILAVPVLLFLWGYSYAKRFTPLVHLWLGLALALAPICAWIALRGDVVLRDVGDLLPAVVLGLAVLFWVAGFDMIYACQDAEFDRRAQLHSIPARLGVKTALRIAAGFHAMTLLFLAGLPWAYSAFGWCYGLGWLVIAALLVVEHGLVRPNDLRRLNLAFFYINAVISLGLLLVGCLDIWWV